MKDIYKAWPQSFIDGLDFLRGKDATYLSHSVYVKRSAELFRSLHAGVTDALGPDNRFDAYTIHDLRGYPIRSVSRHAN